MPDKHIPFCVEVLNMVLVMCSYMNVVCSTYLKLFYVCNC
jgi:hypothetical protein